MLYDQAQIAVNCLEARQATSPSRCRREPRLRAAADLPSADMPSS